MISLYYFRHLPNEMDNPKIKKLITKYGMTGYGFYWFMCEQLYFTSTHQLTLTNLRMRHLAVSANVRRRKARRMLDWMINIGLFGLRGQQVYSQRVDDEVKEVVTALERKKESARKAGLASAAKRRAGGAA